MAARILAVIAAVAMIVGAVAYRYGLPGSEGGSRSATPVLCATELGAACDAAADPEVERVTVSAKRLLSAGTGDRVDAGWLTPGPWPAIVDEGRRLASRPPLFAERRPLATTTLVAVARAGQLPPACGELTWRCLGDAAQDPAFRIGADPASNPVGLFVRAAALGGYLDNPDFAINDLEEQPEAQTWFANLNARFDAAAGFGARSLADFTVKQGSASVYLTTEAAAGKVAGNAGFVVVAPKPVVRIVAGFSPAVVRGGGIDTKAATRALVAAGWVASDRGADEGLPSPGVLLALSEVDR